MSKHFPIGLMAASLLLFACGKDSPPPTAVDESPTRSKAPDIRGEEIIYEADGTSLKGYLAYDASEYALPADAITLSIRP
jgi:hypothetical protein